MKNYQKLTLVFCTLLCATACQNNKGYEFPKAPEQVFLTEKNMPPIEYFTLEKVEVPEAVEIADAYYVYADTLLFSVHEKNPKPYMLSVYNLKTKQQVAGYFKKGSGPQELISLHSFFYRNECFVYDMTQGKCVFMNIDSIAILEFGYEPKIIAIDQSFPILCLRQKDDTLIALNYTHFYGFGYDKYPEFIKIACADGKGHVSVSDFSTDLFGAVSVSARIAHYNNHTNQYLSAWANFPYINIYDENFNLQKQYIGPDNYLPSLTINPDYYNEVFFADTARSTYYHDGLQTDNYIFYINRRCFAKNYYWDQLGKNSEIFCFDKELNLARRFKAKDTKPTYIYLSYCEESGNMYVNVSSDGMEYSLYKCIFEK